jgi:hypothetical protein
MYPVIQSNDKSSHTLRLIDIDTNSDTNNFDHQLIFNGLGKYVADDAAYKKFDKALENQNAIGYLSIDELPLSAVKLNDFIKDLFFGVGSSKWFNRLDRV